MTTFIDFRYTKKLSSALLSGYQPEESSICFNSAEDNYIAIEFPSNVSNKNILDILTEQNIKIASIQIEQDQSISLRRVDQTLLLKTPQGSLNCSSSSNHILGFRWNSNTIGFKYNDSIYESKNLLYSIHKDILLQINKTSNSISILGKGSGRAKRWAQLYYNRSKQKGLGIEIVMDWHHLRSGIPLNGTLTAEKLIELTDFQPKFHSYAIEKEEAEVTDFVKLFSVSKKTDVSLHITPPLYAHFNPDTLNVGLFVIESQKIIAPIADRCNMMDSIIAPTTFVSDIFKQNKINCPIHVVPHGVDTEFYKPVSKRTPLPGGRGFNFLAVSTNVERKNIYHLVRAFLEEFRKNEDVALFLLLRPEFGTTQYNVLIEFDKWEKTYFRSSAPILLSTGYITQNTLKDLYANADAYVMPSNEGFGLTLLEAMASGTPVIALNYGGIKDFVNERNGYPVPKGNPFISKDIDSISYMGDIFYKPDIKKLRATMRYVFENRNEAYKKGLQGRIDCENKFTWDKSAISIARVIEKTYEQNHNLNGTCSRMFNYKAKSNNLLSWVLCVPDDMPIKPSIDFLRSQKSQYNDILCLFTRYARFKDIMLARKAGFLFHRWDGSFSNCKSIIKRIVLTPWAGILYPNERIDGSLGLLNSFLGLQTITINEVLVVGPNGIFEIRFLRPQGSTSNQEGIIFKDIIISLRS